MSSPSPTVGFQALPAGRTPAAVVELLRRLEGNEGIDPFARRLGKIAAAVVRSDRVDDGLRGTWLGHALHPLLTDFPLGAWMSASLLDLFGGPDARRAAQGLLGFGLVAAVPTAAAGLAEWQATAGAARRVGVVHAGMNSVALLLYTSSWVARRRGSHAAAVRLGVGGGVVATLSGYLGGHLTLVRKIGTADPAYGPDVVEETPEDSVPEGRLHA